MTGVCSQKQFGCDGQTETMETPIRALVLWLTQPALAIRGYVDTPTRFWSSPYLALVWMASASESDGQEDLCVTDVILATKFMSPEEKKKIIDRGPDHRPIQMPDDEDGSTEKLKKQSS